MKRFKRNHHGWALNEGGRFLTACKMKLYGYEGHLYRLWVHGLELCMFKFAGKWPTFSVRYRRPAEL